MPVEDLQAKIWHKSQDVYFKIFTLLFLKCFPFFFFFIFFLFGPTLDQENFENPFPPLDSCTMVGHGPHNSLQPAGLFSTVLLKVALLLQYKWREGP